MERIELTTPEQYPLATGTVASWMVDELHYKWSAQHIIIVVKGPAGERREINYTGQKATNLMIVVNTANFSVESQHKKVMKYLIADGQMAGTVTGTAD